MKTMLTKKLSRNGLIGNGLLLLVAVVSMAATGHIASSKLTTHAAGDTTEQQLTFDTLLLQLKGATATDALNAPAISLNKQAASFNRDYLAGNKKLLQRIKDKSEKYFKITDAVFTRYGLPVELKYLAVIESELNTRALSRVGARGAWQLMPETARILSLKVTAKNDERTHFYKSTVAAAKYLRDLYAIFDDWLLVIAAYNSGPGKVLAAIKKSGSRSFWKLQNYLPAESRGHVKKFISTHYYFEGKGSVTTLTKAETIKYRKQMQEYLAKVNAPAKEITEIAVAVNHNSVPVGETGIVRAESAVELFPAKEN